MIVVIDFGSQTTHLIARRLKELGSPAKIIEPEKAFNKIQKLKPAGIILSGGPASVYEKNAPTINKKIFSLGIPVLGICYGQQLTAHLLSGGKTVKDKIREDGPATLTIDIPSPLFDSLPQKSNIWMSHGDTVISPPKGFSLIAHSESIPSAAIANETKKIYGVQFHPEVTHTEYGNLILRNFLNKICNLKPKKRKINITKLIKELKRTVGENKAVAAVSGGVDSTVAAFLVGKAIGKNLTVIYADNGLMRWGTKEEVKEIFEKKLRLNLKIINCQNLFLEKLKGILDPEEKRKIIGRLYIEVFEKEAIKIKNVKFLVQGTIYSDVIESKGSQLAAKIKSHHNVGGLPKNLKLTLLEPLRGFYKDEVREIGRKLGLAEEIIKKQPFPGPGMAIRIIGEINKARLEKIQKADRIVLEEIKKAGYYDKVFQSFPVATNTFSTAVRGDGRFVGEVIALRVVETKDIMSASWTHLPYSLLQKIASRITNEVKGISRVVYDITTKPPATIEWE